MSTASKAGIFGALFFLAQQVARRADDKMAPLGVTTKQWLLLAILKRQFPDTPATLSEAARWYGSSRQNVKVIAGQLEKLGYLAIRRDPEDARAVRLHLTSKVALFDTARELRRQTELLDELFAWATPSELATLSGLCRRWSAALSPKEDRT